MFPQFATPKQRRNFWGGAALVALVLAYGAWHDLSTPERRAALNASSERKALETLAADTRESVEMGVRTMCQDSVLFHTLQRANLGWGASAWMKNGDFIVKQPFTINTLAGKRQFEARCTLRPDGTFDVLMQD
jgi:hypothetical protein